MGQIRLDLVNVGLHGMQLNVPEDFVNPATQARVSRGITSMTEIGELEDDQPFVDPFHYQTLRTFALIMF